MTKDGQGEEMKNIETGQHWQSAIDFLASGLIIVLVFAFRDIPLELLSSPEFPPFIDPPKPYTELIEGAFAGVLIGIYIFFRRKINVLPMVLGMWPYALAKHASHGPLNDIEAGLIYLAALSMFTGVFCILFHFSRIATSHRAGRHMPLRKS